MALDPITSGPPRSQDEPAVQGELAPEEKELLQVLGYLFLEHDRADRAAKIYGALALFEPHDTYILKCLAYSLLRIGDYRRALAVTDDALASGMSAEDADLLQLIRGRALWNLKRHDEARLAMRGVLRRRQRMLRDGS